MKKLLLTLLLLPSLVLAEPPNRFVGSDSEAMRKMERIEKKIDDLNFLLEELYDKMHGLQVVQEKLLNIALNYDVEEWDQW